MSGSYERVDINKSIPRIFGAGEEKPEDDKSGVTTFFFVLFVICKRDLLVHMALIVFIFISPDRKL